MTKQKDLQQLHFDVHLQRNSDKTVNTKEKKTVSLSCILLIE